MNMKENRINKLSTDKHHKTHTYLEPKNTDDLEWRL